MRNPSSFAINTANVSAVIRAASGCQNVPSSTAWKPILQEANIRWFIVDSHGLLHAHPRPRYGVFAPVFTPNGIAVFGRDMESSRQVWSRTEGYPGDHRYRDFYRDIGFDLDFDYVKPHLPSPKIVVSPASSITASPAATRPKQPYQPATAAEAVDGHATHFLKSRVEQVQELSAILDRPPLVISPYDAELFGHWWYEGPTSSISSCAKPITTRNLRADHAGTISPPPSDQPDRHARRVELGRGRLLPRLAQRKERVDLPHPPSHRNE